MSKSKKKASKAKASRKPSDARIPIMDAILSQPSAALEEERKLNDAIAFRFL